MADARALQKLRSRRTQLAREALASFDQRCRRLEADIAAGVAELEALDARIRRQRDDRLTSIMHRPVRPVTLARYASQARAEDETWAAGEKAIADLRIALRAEERSREAARRVFKDMARAEAKLDEAVQRGDRRKAQAAEALAEDGS